MFEPNICGTRYLIDLALASKRVSKPRFMFMSSIASAQAWDKTDPVPEEVMSDASTAVGGGYGSGKHVSEKVSPSH